MACRKKPQLTVGEKSSLTQKAKHSKHLKTIAKQVDCNLEVKRSWQKLTEENKEIVLFRVTGGETVTSVCDQLGVGPGLVYQAAYLDEEFGKRLAIARELGQHALVDRLLSLPADETLGVERTKLLSDNIKWIAGRINRKDYGDKLAIDARIQNVPVMLPEEALPIIDGEEINDDGV